MDQTQDHDFFVPSLEFVRGVAFDAGGGGSVVAERLFDEGELGAVGRDEADVCWLEARREEGFDELEGQGRFDRVCDARSVFEHFAGLGEERVGVDETGFCGRVEQVAEPAGATGRVGADFAAWFAHSECGAGAVVVDLETGDVGDAEGTSGDGLSAAFEAAAVDESVAEGHDVFAHAVLVLEIDH